MCGITRSEYGKWEHDNPPAPLKKLPSLETALGFDKGELKREAYPDDYKAGRSAAEQIRQAEDLDEPYKNALITVARGLSNERRGRNR